MSQPVNIVDLTAEGTRAEGSGRVLGVGSKEAMVTSPDVIDIEEDESGPPAKRVKMTGDDFQAAGEEGPSKISDMAHEILPGAALPILPRARPSAGRMGAYRRNRLGIDPSARKAHGVEAPVIATRVPPPKNVLDFSPWTGSHQEDVLNENIIKGGYFDKAASTNQSETNNAKTSIWPSLSQKNHAGLSALSYMYVAVMEKRQALGKCTAPSTFKPPPRLAVQEAKRAKWLEDLADSTVSLRRLSKTIPHGIKGKLLMEQCLSKYIPLHRAMWLVRGVGMHELRAFRRKGFNEAQAASGEIKWVREWTVNVTQFLEDVMAACGQPDWQKKMDYAVKLATALYSEKLLDLDYYLDWIVSSLAESTSERLPIWIIITQIHWKDLTMFGRRGRRLAEGILEHLRILTEAGTPGSAPLKTNLHKMVTILAVTNQGCLILPRTWQKYRGLLTPSSSSPAESPARNVARRNERLAAPLSKTPENTRSAYLDLYDALDSIGLDFDLDIPARKCIGLIPDPATLVPALLEWASTRYRTGTSRIYLAAGVIAQVQADGHDTDSIVLQYLGNAKGLAGAAEDLVHRVIVELVRLQAFSVGRCLQWLIASGALYAEEPSSAAALIAALPSIGLPVHVVNTRNMLMNRLGCTMNESTALESALNDVEEVLATAADQDTTRKIALPKALTMSARYRLAQQVAEKAGQAAKEHGLSLQQVCTLRDLIEEIGDISSLAELVAAASSSPVCAVLATASDTVNYNAASFAALGQLTPLVDRLDEQYRVLRTQQTLDRSFILALTGLAKRVPGTASLVKLLADDLLHCEQQTSPEACSPASDSLRDMQATKLDSDEDIDAVFASGDIMDEALMQRMFSRIVQRASRPAGPTSLTRVCGWFEQLRSVNASIVLKSIVDKYLRTVIAGGSASAISTAAIAGLTLSGCASLGNIAELVRTSKDPQIAQRVLSVFISPADELGWESTESYRFRLQQERCQAEHAGDLMQILRTALGASNFDAQDDDAVRAVVRSVTFQENMIGELFAGIAVNERARSNTVRLLSAILGLNNDGAIDISSTIATADPLSVRFSIAAMHVAGGAGELSALRDAILRAFEEESEVWPQLLSIADDDTIRALREEAQQELVRMTSDQSATTSERREAEMRRTLDLLAVTTNVSQKPDVAFVAIIVERLREIEKQLSSIGELTKANPPAKEELLCKLDLLLRLAALSIYTAEGETDSAQQTRTSLLHILCALLVHQALRLHRQTIEYIFDLASTLSDSLPEATLTSLKPRLPAANSVSTTSILGGSLNTTDAWLALATQIPPSGPVGATQQQRALNKHPSAQQQQPQPQKSSTSTPVRPPGPTARGWPAAGRMGGVPAEVKMTPFQLRQWEVISDPAATVGENDTAVSLGLFGMRKV